MSNDHDNVIPLRRPQQRTRANREALTDMELFPVHIRGNVTFGRLMSGLATVGLTVRIDARSGRMVITDDTWE